MGVAALTASLVTAMPALAANPHADSWPGVGSCGMSGVSGFNLGGPLYSYAQTWDSQLGGCADTTYATVCTWNGSSYPCVYASSPTNALATNYAYSSNQVYGYHQLVVGSSWSRTEETHPY